MAKSRDSLPVLIKHLTLKLMLFTFLLPFPPLTHSHIRQTDTERNILFQKVHLKHSIPIILCNPVSNNSIAFSA